MRSIDDFISAVDNAKANVIIDTSLYDIRAIHAASYEFTGSYHVLITPSDDKTVSVIFEAKDKASGVNVVEDLKTFANSLIDHQIRLHLDKANGKIRELIVAHAFSPLDLKKETKSL